MLKALILITSLLFAGAAQAQYKWVDKNGKVQYGDTPPPGARTSTLRPPPAPIAQQESAAKKDEAKKDEAKKDEAKKEEGKKDEAKKDEPRKEPLTTAEKDAEFRKRREEAEKERQKQVQAAQEAEERRDNCARARESLRTFETGRVARTDAKGERYYLDEAQIAKETARARQLAQQYCN